MGIVYQDDLITIYHGDCREILPSLKDISAVVTDPPYELGFMGKSWDSKGISFQSDTWRLIREACLPGAMLLSFGGTRTSHRIACAIEDAGWQIRDTIMWVYGSGFPKSLDISKAIDKKAGTKREVIGYIPQFPDGTRGATYRGQSRGNGVKFTSRDETTKGLKPVEKGATPEAKLWEGYGTTLKPAYEPIIVAMNPLDGTFADNALKHKVTGLNIDGCRIGMSQEDIGDRRSRNGKSNPKLTILGNESGHIDFVNAIHSKGRFPSNFIIDGSQEVMELFPDTKSGSKLGQIDKQNFNYKSVIIENAYGDSGSAARFFYCAKSSRRERDAGLEDMPPPDENLQGLDTRGRTLIRPDGTKTLVERWQPDKARVNNHPTVKPLALMTYLCKLIKMPEYNLILDPFCGSGSTLLACKKLGIKAISIDSNEEYCQIAIKRLNAL